MKLPGEQAADQRCPGADTCTRERHSHEKGADLFRAASPLSAESV